VNIYNLEITRQFSIALQVQFGTEKEIGYLHFLIYGQERVIERTFHLVFSPWLWLTYNCYQFYFVLFHGNPGVNAILILILWFRFMCGIDAFMDMCSANKQILNGLNIYTIPKSICKYFHVNCKRTQQNKVRDIRPPMWSDEPAA
jgi:hypothetical protein